MTEIAIIGSGVVGAAIAYELSLIKGLKITLFDENQPASGSTGAALGVLMGVISQKTKGRAWQLRQTSMQRYESLIPELESLTGISIPWNTDGIVMLCLLGEDMSKWQKLVDIRRQQGWHLEIWQPEELQVRCPNINLEQIIAAIYSPSDRQVNPTILTQALVAAAQLNGVNCQFGVKVENVGYTDSDGLNLRQCHQLQTTDGTLNIDYLVLSSGNGSTALTELMAEKIDIRPVLGQAIQWRLNQPVSYADFQPVITGDDVHIVPLGHGEYWVGATVEFPSNIGELIPDWELLEQLKEKAIAFYPALADATILHRWSGKRPRPENQSAPIIGKLSGYSNVLLATGHYRNGVLLAPATAVAIKDIIKSNCL